MRFQILFQTLLPLYSLPLVLFCFSSALAWDVKLTNVKGNIEKGTYYWQEIYFYSDTGSDILNDFFLSLDYDETKVELAGIMYSDYDNGAPILPEKKWDGGTLPHTDNGNLVYNLNGSETFDYINQFTPSNGNTLLVRVAWDPLVTENNVTVAAWTDATPSDFITVNNTKNWMPTDPVNIKGEPTLNIANNATANTSTLVPKWIDLNSIGQPWEANLGTRVILPLTLDPTADGTVTITASSSKQRVVRNDTISFFSDPQGKTPLSSPFSLTANSSVTIYLALTTEPDENARDTTQLEITVTDTEDSSNKTSATYNLVVELAEATMDQLNPQGGMNSYHNGAAQLMGEKALGSKILLKVGSGPAFEIVPANIDGTWQYSWNPVNDGTYTYTVINQAGSISETIASGLMIKDTQIPAVSIVDPELTSIGFVGSRASTHTIEILATEPQTADSSFFGLCLDGVDTGLTWEYDTEGYITPKDNHNHQIQVIAVDRAGNRQACTDGPLISTSFSTNRQQISYLFIYKVTSGQDHVQFEWAADDPGAASFRIYGRSSEEEEYTLISGQPTLDNSGFKYLQQDNTQPAALRYYKITSGDGKTLAEFKPPETGEPHSDLLLPATMNPLNPLGGMNSYHNGVVQLTGEKQIGTQILLKVDSSPAIEIVPATVDGPWQYSWNPVADGAYTYTVINQVGSISETIANGLMVVDTQSPVIHIADPTLTYIGFSGSLSPTHTIQVLANEPQTADSSFFGLCLAGVDSGQTWEYDTVGYVTARDNQSHKITPIAVDMAGNRQACTNNPSITTNFFVNRQQISALHIHKVISGQSYIQFEWSAADTGAASFQIYARSSEEEEYSLISGQPSLDKYQQKYHQQDNTQPAELRYYKVTSAGGKTLAELGPPQTSNPTSILLLISPIISTPRTH